MSQDAVADDSASYNVRAVVTPRHKEIWVYGKPHSKSGSLRLRKKPRKFEDLDEFEQLESRIRRERYYKDRLQVIRRLIDCNYVHGKSKFCTFTYRDPEKTDPVACGEDWEDFIARLRYHMETKHGLVEDIEYFKVWEIQKKRGRVHGDWVVHWHAVLFNMPFLKKKVLQDLWGLGIVDIRAIEDANAAGDYVSKYVGKAMAENSRSKRKSYTVSRGLKRPVEWTASLDAEELACVVDGLGPEPLYDYTYGTPLGESIRYLSVSNSFEEPRKRKSRPRTS
jgi:hypothetical protein